MSQQTVLNALHRQLGAKMVDFGGWDMPIHYTSQIAEHHAVRKDAGWFDVSHMTVVDLTGPRVREFLRYLVANNVDKLKVRGKALYTCMLNASAGVIDDLIVYFLDESWFRIVVNAATRDKDMPWIEAQAKPFGVTVSEQPTLAMVAVQGPNARAKAASLLSPSTAAAALALGKFVACEGDGMFIARTGYTGEDGFEIMLPQSEAVAFCQRLTDAGVLPAGLGARDTLRLEAAMNLYGQDMDETTTPLESALAWTLALDKARDFIGRSALEAQLASGAPRQLIALVMDEKGVLRHGQVVHTLAGVGEITSGTFSPSANKAIAFARVPSGELGAVTVDIRGKRMPVRAVKAPFVRDGKVLPGIDLP
jgi:aminomethyltransferase